MPDDRADSGRGIPRGRPRDPEGEFTGAFSSLLFEADCQLAAVEQHSAAEGHRVPVGTILESYDRALHPWMHSRRPADLKARLQELMPYV